MKKEVQVLSSKEIMEILDTNRDGLKYLSKCGKLKESLSLKGLDFIDAYKIGRNKYYRVTKLDEIDVLNNLLISSKTRDRDKFYNYLFERLSNISENRVSLIGKVQTKHGFTLSYDTASSWDSFLVDNEIIEQTKGLRLDCSVSTKKNCVYRWLDKDGNILYIGKAKDLKTRTYSHIYTSDDELHRKWFDTWDKVEYISFETHGDCCFAEMYYISKNKPVGNIEMTYDDITLNISVFDNAKWNHYISREDVKESEGMTVNSELTEKGLALLDEINGYRMEDFVC